MIIRATKINYITSTGITNFHYIDNRGKEHILTIKGRYNGKITLYEVEKFIQERLKKIDKIN